MDVIQGMKSSPWLRRNKFIKFLFVKVQIAEDFTMKIGEENFF